MVRTEKDQVVIPYLKFNVVANFDPLSLINFNIFENHTYY